LPRRTCVLAAWLSLAAAAPAAADEPPPRARVEVRSASGPRTLEGTLVVEAQDGGLLLELADQRYELLQPDQIVARRPSDAARPAETPREFGRRILGELPAGFDVHVTRHYVVCFDTSREYAVWCAALFERLSETFVTYWTNAGLDIRRPDRPLVVVIFADRRAYEAFAARDLGAAADRVVGYYNLLSNRVTTFDRPRFAAEAGGPPTRPGRPRDSRQSRSGRPRRHARPRGDASDGLQHRHAPAAGAGAAVGERRHRHLL
jgi:hypothetical protein